MILKLVRTPGIYLVGFMGSGKTTVGRILADRLGWNFVDLDAEIEQEQRMTISDIFERHGEAHFRKLECDALRRRVRMIGAGHPMVLALGGGAFVQPETCELLEYHGVTVWLDCPLEVARERVGSVYSRPLARDPGKFEQLYEERRVLYARADYRVEAGGDPEQVAEAILALPIF